MERPNILSIDDEPSFTDLLKQYFEPRGYGIDVTTSGDEGLELIGRKEYDVVLLDLKMAGLGGDDVMAKIKGMGSKAKVIFITAFCDSGKTKDRVMGNGAFAYVEKPITSLKHLENLVNEAARAEKQENRSC